jgi:hypothetical protein
VPSASPKEDGYSIWDRVATAASTLTVSVSKAWQANVNDAQGSEGINFIAFFEDYFQIELQMHRRTRILT